MPSPVTILVVDDNAPGLMATARILRQAGYEVAEAADGATGLHQIRTLRPSLVLLDVVLPDISGREVLRQVRADTSLHGVAVMLLSAEQTAPEQQADGLDGGADSYIARPIANTELLARVRALLRQRELTEQLRASDEKFRQLAENITDVFWIRSPDLKEVHYISPAFEKIWGRKAEDLYAHPEKWADFILNEDRERVLEAFSALKGPVPNLDIEYRIVRPDGEIRWVRVRGFQVRDGTENKLIRHAGIVTDITERKKFEEQFRRAQRMESLGTLARGIAHELNNLLAPVAMGAGLLRQFNADPQSLPVLETIEKSAARAANLVKQVLAFARGVEGSRVELPIDEIIREIESIIRNTFPKKITVTTNLARDPWPVVADPTQLNQVLVNICVNARDAMPGGGHLILTTENVEIDAHYSVMNHHVTPGRYVLLSVTDNGCGMTPEVVDRIFEPFFTTKEFGKGTGLGLSTALGIIRSHGGFIHVYSEPNKGSTFKIYLPANTNPAAAEVAAPPADDFPRGNGELIMVVDDEPGILEITQQTLQGFGYKVLTADDGARAVAAYAQQRDAISLVITDMTMPVMDGAALVAALRRLNPRVRIIAASGLSANDTEARNLGLDVKHFLTKPYAAETLLKLVKAVLAE